MQCVDDGVVAADLRKEGKTRRPKNTIHAKTRPSAPSFPAFPPSHLGVVGRLHRQAALGGAAGYGKGEKKWVKIV